MHSAHRSPERRSLGRRPRPHEPIGQAFRRPHSSLRRLARLLPHRAGTCPVCHPKAPGPNPRRRREGPEGAGPLSPSRAFPASWKVPLSPCRVRSACRHQHRRSRRTWRASPELPRIGNEHAPRAEAGRPLGHSGDGARTTAVGSLRRGVERSACAKHGGVLSDEFDK